MGKRIADKGSEQTVRGFGCSLEDSAPEVLNSPQGTAEPEQAETTPELVNQFHRAMINIYTTAKRECGYTATRFFQMVNEIGGLATAKQLISKPGGTEGFTTLWEHGRLDLTVEAHVIKPEFQKLFTAEEIKMCKDRLLQFNYHVDT